MSRDDAAFAANWRAVLVVDAAVGVAVSLAGVVVMLIASWAIGIALIVLGATYDTLVAVRARRWARLRRSSRPHGRAGAGA